MMFFAVQSARGLQNALDKLLVFCKKWGLTINVNKTKAIVCNSKKSCLHSHLVIKYYSIVIVKAILDLFLHPPVSLSQPKNIYMTKLVEL